VYLGIDASNHISRHKNLLIEMEEITKIVSFGDALIVEVKCKDKIKKNSEEWGNMNDRRCALYFRDEEQYPKYWSIDGEII
jgi:hypothetical protein